MPLWTPIETERDFTSRIKLGTTPEGLHLEFKTRLEGFKYPKRDNLKELRAEAQKELCRDVAQFANTEGGTLIFGVAEADHGGVLVADRIVPMETPNEQRAWIEQALLQYLVPSTISKDIRIISLKEGHVLVVNVPPDERLVTVWDGKNQNVVYRTSHGKQYMNPDETGARRMNVERVRKLAFERVHATLKGGHGSVRLASGYWVWDINRQLAVRREGVSITLFSHDETHLTLRIKTVESHLDVWIPYGVIRDVWNAGNSELGLLLSTKVVLSGAALVLMVDS